MSTCKMIVTEKPQEFTAYEVNYDNLESIVMEAASRHYKTELRCRKEWIRKCDLHCGYISQYETFNSLVFVKDGKEIIAPFGEIVVFFCKDDKQVIWSLSIDYFDKCFEIKKEPEPPLTGIPPLDGSESDYKKQGFFNRLFKKEN